MIKLLKYELKQTWRMGCTLLGGTLLGCLGLMISPFRNYSAFAGLYILIFTLIIIGAPLALVIYCIISFNQEFVGGQGYLMMTLPIKARDLIWAKFMGQLIWNTLTGIILLISIPIIINTYTGEGIIIGMIGGPDFAQSFLNGFSTYVLTMFIIYFSIVVLSMRPRSNHITFMKIILAMVMTNVMTLLSGGLSMLLVAIPLAVKQGFPGSMPDIIKFFEYMQGNMQGLNMVNIVINSLLATIFYLLTKNIIEKRVQL